MSRRIKNVLEYLENSAEKYPHKTAVADEKNAMTYAELKDSAMRIGSFLAKHTRPQSPVAVLSNKSVSTLCVFLGCAYAGCFYVPLNVQHPKERRDRILNTLENPLLLVDDNELRLVPENYAGKVIAFSDLSGDFEEAALSKIRAQHIDIDPLYILFTSGSTGEPKGIAVSHRSVIDFIEEFTSLFGIGENDVIGNQAPFDFDVSVKDIYSSLKCGATLQIIPKQKFSFPTYLIDYLCERKITTLIWAVSALCILSGYHAFTYKVPDTLQKILFSGEVMPISHLNEWKSYYPGAMFVNLYGPTEITCNCTYYILDKGRYEREVLPIGVPFPNERVFLLNEKNEKVSKAGEQGEICVSGTALSLGYYKNEAETQKAFVRNPLNNAYTEMIYRTGDLGYYDESGLICFTGRKDFQIKHMGHRIELSEIEKAIQDIEDVSRALCIFDQESDKIWAFYCGKEENPKIASVLRKKLPAYMVPHKCVYLKDFPLTENGKIDRKKLRKEYII